MKEITFYDEYPDIAGYLVTQKDDPALFKNVLESCAEAFGTETQDDHDKEYPYLVSLYTPKSEPIILAAYRFMVCKKAMIGNNYNLYTAGYFDYSNEFANDVLPFAVELGRSFTIANSKETSSVPKAVLMHCLRSIWNAGLAPLLTVCEASGIHYVIGQVSIPSEKYTEAEMKDIIAMFCVNYGSKELFEPKKPKFTQEEIIATAENCGYTGVIKQDLKILKSRLNGKVIPMLLKRYAQLVDWNPNALVCNLATEVKVNRVDIPFCLDINLITSKAREEHFSNSFNNVNVFKEYL